MEALLREGEAPAEPRIAEDARMTSGTHLLSGSAEPRPPDCLALLQLMEALLRDP